MCVKEFYGYNCGHCSVPILRQCPLSTSNPHYPVCKFPAERPIFTNDFCHPCSRVVWNMKVLKDEEEHRALHLQGECMCEVIFEGENQEKRHRTRSGKGKDKANDKDVYRDEQHGKTGVVDHGAFEHGVAEGEPGGYGGRRDAIEEYNGMENNMQMVKLGEDIADQNWEPNVHMSGRYEYVGYYIENDQARATDPEQSYAVALGGGDGQDQRGQSPMGEAGAGMKWYPQQQQYYQIPQLPSTTVYPIVTGDAFRRPRAISIPIGRYDESGPAAHAEGPVVLRQPLVVSSDMMRYEST